MIGHEIPCPSFLKTAKHIEDESRSLSRLYQKALKKYLLGKPGVVPNSATARTLGNRILKLVFSQN
jgi:hypothetical protein